MLVIAGWITVWQVRRRLTQPDESSGAGFTLSDLRRLHREGQMTDAEFEQAKAKVLSSSKVDLNKASSTSGGSFADELNMLRRSRTDRWISGVCGGLAQVSGVDSWVWRLVFTVFTLTFGFGAVIYLLLWIFVPEE